jgi:hypothetical protein
MSLVCTLSSSKSFTLQQPITGFVDTNIIIDFVTDRPSLSTVSASVRGGGVFVLNELSYENYNTPPWTDDLVIAAVQNYFYNF